MKEGESVQAVYPSGRFTTVSQIHETVMAALGLPSEAVDCFSIWLSSKHLQLQLKSYHLPCKLFKKWKDLLSQYTNTAYDDICQDEPILTFQRNTFFPLKEERKMIDPKKKSENEKAIDLLYNEAVFNVTKTRYPLEETDYHELAGIQAATFAVEHPGEGLTSGNLHPYLQTFYPPHLLEPPTGGQKSLLKLFRQRSVEHSLAEEKLRGHFEKVASKRLSAHNLKILYLQYCWSKPFYGSVMFHGQIERPFKAVHILTYSDKRVTVALNPHCLHILDSKSPPGIMLYLTYDQLSWEFEEAPEDGEDFYSSLWLEFDSVLELEDREEKVTKRVQVFSPQAPMMDAMITRCVGDIVKTEEELKQMRKAQGYDEVLPECSITTHKPGESPRTQRQGRNYKEDKMRCTTFNDKGEIIGDGGFTLTRPFKRRTPRSGSNATPGDPALPQEGHALQPLETRERSSTKDSFSSTDM
ncbi:FERM domain-containing protein 8 [Geodia barretti]|uniref:FERM domain-containing protein 8 n=2 Tax=Geodia barretti TaxID=519541 RepID=A0AA35SBV3_GEOBA|nr:FERM domain-containing protein 8 [Geodia barretti]